MSATLVYRNQALTGISTNTQDDGGKTISVLCLQKLNRSNVVSSFNQVLNVERLQGCRISPTSGAGDSKCSHWWRTSLTRVGGAGRAALETQLLYSSEPDRSLENHEAQSTVRITFSRGLCQSRHRKIPCSAGTIWRTDWTQDWFWNTGESSLHRYTKDKNEARYVGGLLIPAGRALGWPGLQQVPCLHRPNQNQGTGSSFREEDEKLVDS